LGNGICRLGVSTGRALVAILEAARFALMRHFLRPEDLLPCQGFRDEPSLSSKTHGLGGEAVPEGAAPRDAFVFLRPALQRIQSVGYALAPPSSTLCTASAFGKGSMCS
jgi:hypothetical protein